MWQPFWVILVLKFVVRTFCCGVVLSRKETTLLEEKGDQIARSWGFDSIGEVTHQARGSWILLRTLEIRELFRIVLDPNVVVKKWNLFSNYSLMEFL